MNSFTAFFDYLNNVISLDAEETSLIRNALVQSKMVKGDFLAEENKHCDQIAFICSGYFRIYITQDVEQTTVHLAGPGEFISSFSSFLTHTPSQEYIQALTDADVLLIDYASLHALYDKKHKLERIGRLIVESYFIAKDHQVTSFIKDSAEDRYKKLVHDRPGFIQHIPLQYIASYLGVKPETLSRIRARGIS